MSIVPHTPAIAAAIDECRLWKRRMSMARIRATAKGGVTDRPFCRKTGALGNCWWRGGGSWASRSVSTPLAISACAVPALIPQPRQC